MFSLTCILQNIQYWLNILLLLQSQKAFTFSPVEFQIKVKICVCPTLNRQPVEGGWNFTAFYLMLMTMMLMVLYLVAMPTSHERENAYVTWHIVVVVDSIGLEKQVNTNKTLVLSQKKIHGLMHLYFICTVHNMITCITVTSLP